MRRSSGCLMLWGSYSWPLLQGESFLFCTNTFVLYIDPKSKLALTRCWFAKSSDPHIFFKRCGLFRLHTSHLQSFQGARRSQKEPKQQHPVFLRTAEDVHGKTFNKTFPVSVVTCSLCLICEAFTEASGTSRERGFFFFLFFVSRLDL